MVLEFLTTWNEQNKDKYNTPFFYRQLNMIKKCMDHLYELDLFGVLLLDEKQIYGFTIASIVGNVATIHINLSLNEVLGAYEDYETVLSIAIKDEYVEDELMLLVSTSGCLYNYDGAVLIDLKEK